MLWLPNVLNHIIRIDSLVYRQVKHKGNCLAVYTSMSDLK